jgi:hypothetical protein
MNKKRKHSHDDVGDTEILKLENEITVLKQQVECLKTNDNQIQSKHNVYFLLAYFKQKKF